MHSAASILLSMYSISTLYSSEYINACWRMAWFEYFIFFLIVFNILVFKKWIAEGNLPLFFKVCKLAFLPYIVYTCFVTPSIMSTTGTSSYEYTLDPYLLNLGWGLTLTFISKSPPLFPRPFIFIFVLFYIPLGIVIVS